MSERVAISRRRFFIAVGAGTASAALAGASALGAQNETGAQPNVSAASNAPMDESVYRPTRLPAKANARPLLTADERDELEHRIHCQCGCTLDVYTCRTTDFSCGISPALHRDVLAMVEGGYSGDEIIQAFVGTYGETARLAPEKSGFNLAGYYTPIAALGAGALVVAGLIRRWGRERPIPLAGPVPGMAASDDEMARLDAAVRNEDAR